MLQPELVESLIEKERAQQLRMALYGLGNDIAARTDALLQLATAADECVPTFIMSQLDAPQRNLKWTSALVAAIEYTHFEDAADRQKIKQWLRIAVLSFCQTHDSSWSAIVWSAIRSYGSLISANEAHTLLDFLGSKDGVEKDIVTFQVIQNVFYHSPAPQSASLRPMKDRVYKLSAEAIEPGAIEAGVQAAFALESFCALAALADPRLTQLAPQVSRLNQPWFSWQVLQTITTMRRQWVKSSSVVSSPDGSAAIARMKQVMEELQERSK